MTKLTDEQLSSFRIMAKEAIFEGGYRLMTAPDPHEMIEILDHIATLDEEVAHIKMSLEESFEHGENYHKAYLNELDGCIGLRAENEKLKRQLKCPYEHAHSIPCMKCGWISTLF